MTCCDVRVRVSEGWVAGVILLLIIPIPKLRVSAFLRHIA